MGKERTIEEAIISHAREDMKHAPDPSRFRAPLDDRNLLEGFRDWVRDNKARQPSFMSELSAMVREGIKDVRATIMESYFGRPEHPGEPGAPLNPTQQVVTDDMGLGIAPEHGRGPSYDDELRSAQRGGNDHHRGHER
jgi:hypothetical protein